jgi:mycothiol synthase
VSSVLADRPYQDDDLPRLQEALARWRHDAGFCGYCHVGDLPDRIYEGIRGREPVGDLVRVWEAGPNLVGLAIALRFDTAFDVFVAPDLRGTDAERLMLEWGFRTTRRHTANGGKDHQHVVTDVFGCDVVRASLLIGLRFERFRLFDHIAERSLGTGEPLRPVRPPDGFTIRAATMEDAERLGDARNSAFDDDWSAGEYRREVMSKPGYDPQREIVAVSADGRIAAFTVIWLDRLNKVGNFEPVGTHGEYRRRGLARAVMLEGLARMRSEGMTSATVEYDATNEPAAELYRSLGFAKRYEMWGYRRA